MSTSMQVGLICIVAGVLIAVFNPLGPVGASDGPGWGDVLNGSRAPSVTVGGIVAGVGALRRPRS
jgi:hypothetical protein